MRMLVGLGFSLGFGQGQLPGPPTHIPHPTGCSGCFGCQVVNVGSGHYVWHNKCAVVANATCAQVLQSAPGHIEVRLAVVYGKNSLGWGSSCPMPTYTQVLRNQDRSTATNIMFLLEAQQVRSRIEFPAQGGEGACAEVGEGGRTMVSWLHHDIEGCSLAEEHILGRGRFTS